MAAAKAAFPAWKDLSPQDRGVYLEKLASLIRESNDDLARLEAMSMGKPVSGYFDAGVAADNLSWFAQAGWSVQGTSSLNTPGYLNMTVKQPYGVAACIIPWNVPVLFFASKIGPALAAGNTVVLKSSEKAPLTVSSTPYLLAKRLLLKPTVCLRRQPRRKGRLPTWRSQRHLRLRCTSRHHPLLPHGRPLPQLHRILLHRAKDPSRRRSLQHETRPHGTRREIACRHLRRRRPRNRHRTNTVQHQVPKRTDLHGQLAYLRAGVCR